MKRMTTVRWCETRQRHLCCTIAPLFGAACLSLHGNETGRVRIHGTVSQGYIHSSDHDSIENSSEGTFDSSRFDLAGNLILKIEQHYPQGPAGNLGFHRENNASDEWTATLLKMSYLF